MAATSLSTPTRVTHRTEALCVHLEIGLLPVVFTALNPEMPAGRMIYLRCKSYLLGLELDSSIRVATNHDYQFHTALAAAPRQRRS